MELLIEADHHLLDVDASERSITHRLAMHYQALFPTWDVDCEYNRNLRAVKQIEIDPPKLLADMRDRLTSLLTKNNSLRENSEQLHEMLHLIKSKPLAQNDAVEDPDGEMLVGQLSELLGQLGDTNRLLYDVDLSIALFILDGYDGRKVIKNVYPDIIVHHRNTQKNLLVLEAKKSTHKDARSIGFDYLKLRAMTEQPDLAYRYGAFAEIPIGVATIPSKRFSVTRFKSYPKLLLVR